MKHYIPDILFVLRVLQFGDILGYIFLGDLPLITVFEVHPGLHVIPVSEDGGHRRQGHHRRGEEFLAQEGVDEGALPPLELAEDDKTESPCFELVFYMGQVCPYIQKVSYPFDVFDSI